MHELSPLDHNSDIWICLPGWSGAVSRTQSQYNPLWITWHGVTVRTYQVFWGVLLRGEVPRSPVRVHQVPVAVDEDAIPAMVVLVALELVAGTVV